MLKTSLETGIIGDEKDLIERMSAFGSNTYPKKKTRSFLVGFIYLFYMQYFFPHRIRVLLYGLTYFFLLVAVPLGSLARLDIDNIDYSCCGIFGTWIKD